MLWRILKKDLKRKKAMNVILLVFIILASMFVSSGTNNIISVTTALDDYFEMADAPDYLAVTMNKAGAVDVDEILHSAASVKSFGKEKILYMDSDSITFEDEESKNVTNLSFIFLQSDGDMSMNYILDDGGILESVKSGEFYMTAGMAEDIGLEIGDKMTVKLGGVSCSFTFAGGVRDAVLGSKGIGIQRYIISAEDFEKFISAENVEQFYGGQLIYIRTSDIEKMLFEIKPIIDSALLTGDKATIKFSYVFDMMVVGLLLAVSLILIAVAFVVLRFTIVFTLSEEFREIGVMKAIGIRNRKIRGLYLAKYAALSVIGAVIGLALSFPFGEMLVSFFSKSIMINNRNAAFANIICAVLIVGVIMLFSYGCTGKVGKMAPIDAVRNGQTGERFRRKSLLHLGRSRLPQAAFLSVNDVLSSPKQFSIVIVVFTLCILLMTIMSNFALTLKSEKILRFFDMPSSEAHILDGEILGEILVDQSVYKQIIADTEKLLADNGMPGKCTMTMSTEFETSHKGKTAKISFYVMKGETNDTLYVDKGSAPQKTDEIVVTVSVLDDLGAEIGDRVTAIINGKEYEFIITGTYSSFMSPTAFLYKDFDFGNLPANNIMGVQIHFDGNPDKAQINKNIEKLKDLLDTGKVYSTSEFINNFTGMSDTLNVIKQMMMIVTVIVTALLVILMERSFISKEKSEIALMKAVGIGNGSIILQHSLRFVIASVIACIVSSVVLMPISNVMMNWVGNMVGDVSGMKCDFDPLEIFVFCPAILIGVTVIGSFLTALYTKTIKASDTASIE